MDYPKLKKRILDILQNNQELSNIISEWRTFDYPENESSDSYPLISIASATNPLVSRTHIANSPDVDSISQDNVVWEVWILCLANEASPEITQNKFFEIEKMVRDILQKNVRLVDPVELDDPLCHTLEISSVPRLSNISGTITDGLNIIIRITDFE